MKETEFQNPNKGIMKQVQQINKKLNRLAEKKYTWKIQWRMESLNSHIPTWRENATADRKECH